MACCAFAIFLICQFYVAVDAVSGRLGLRRRRESATPNAAVDWRLGSSPQASPVAVVPLRFVRIRRRIAATALVLSMAALGFAVAGPLHSLADVRASLANPLSWCRGSVLLGNR